jgi:transposase-like protein
MGSKRVELFAAIRFDWQRNQMSIRALARKYDVHRRTVRQAIASPLPPDRKVPVRAAPVREAVTRWIDEMLSTWRRRLSSGIPRLRDEHDARASNSTAAKYVRRRRAEITAAQARAEAASVAGFMPQA